MTEVREFAGVVELRLVDANTRRERNAVCLVLDDGSSHLLTRHGGHAFHDPELSAFIGKRIRCTGRLEEPYLFFAEIGEDS